MGDVLGAFQELRIEALEFFFGHVTGAPAARFAASPIASSMA